ncbi:hypothetical protein DVH24_004390 [Malus domestica]|uniref:Tropinone reductase I n=1 Tax=Malus domestica TaxID=3750 RepID=A0A498IAM4_MALDO|nr:hypothetical protein DVH24_004390 [Malus domestica]
MASFDSQRWSLKGRTALVTGGTKGIGFAVVEELAGLGATVHMCARNGELLHERIQEWKSKGFEVSGSVCDLTSKDQREELIRTVSSVFYGKLNILVSFISLPLLELRRTKIKMGFDFAINDAQFFSSLKSYTCIK